MKLQYNVEKSPWAEHEDRPWVVIAIRPDGLVEDAKMAGERRGFFRTMAEAKVRRDLILADESVWS